MVNRKFLLKTFLNLYGKINSDWNIFVEIKMVDLCETKSWSTKSARIFRRNRFDCCKWGNYLHQPYADCHYQNRKKYLRPDLRQGYFLSYSHLWFFAETERNKGVESQNSLVESGFYLNIEFWMKSSPLFQLPRLWGFWWTRKSPRRYKPSHGKMFLKIEKSPRCGGLVQAKKYLHEPLYVGFHYLC